LYLFYICFIFKMSENQQQQNTEVKTKNIIVAGKTQVGKTALLKAFCDRYNVDSSNFLVGNESISTTQSMDEPKQIKFYVGNIEYNMLLIDTIGLFDTKYEHSHIVKQIKVWLYNHKNKEISAILYVAKKSAFTQQEVDAFLQMNDIFEDSSKVKALMHLVLTHFDDESDDEINQWIIQASNHNQQFNSVASRCGLGVGGYCFKYYKGNLSKYSSERNHSIDKLISKIGDSNSYVTAGELATKGFFEKCIIV